MFKKLVIFIVVVIAVLVLVNNYHTPARPIPENTATSTPKAWHIFISDKYHIKFEYPDDWQVYEGLSPGETPVINVYKKSETQKPPFIHHNAVTNVSFFPHGVPTEGLQGVTVPTTMAFKEIREQGIDWTLADGSHFATFATFRNPPLGWKEYGFAWARLAIANETEVCMKAGQEVAMEQCDMGIESEGGIIVYKGTIDQADRDIQQRIFQSLTFNL